MIAQLQELGMSVERQNMDAQAKPRPFAGRVFVFTGGVGANES